MESQIADKVAELCQVPRESIKILNSLFYRYQRDGEEYVARVTGEPDLAQQQTEVAWVNYLADNGIGIVRAAPSANGALVEEFTLGEDPYFLVSLQRAPGKPPTREQWDRPLFKKLGGQIGKMHRLTQDFHQQFPQLQRGHWHQAEIYNPDFLPQEFDVARGKCAEVIEQVQALPKNKDTYGLIHGDIHQWNFHLWRNKTILFDTDECEMHYFAHDLGVLINSAVEESFNGASVNSYAEEFIGCLLEGYAEHWTLTPQWVAQLPLFIKLREIMSFIDAFLEWDMERLSLQQRIVLNRYQNAIENDVPVLHLDFKQFV